MLDFHAEINRGSMIVYRKTETKKRPAFASRFDGLGERIRTSGLLNPIQARYQTALHPDAKLFLVDCLNPWQRWVLYTTLQKMSIGFLKEFEINLELTKPFFWPFSGDESVKFRAYPFLFYRKANLQGKRIYSIIVEKGRRIFFKRWSAFRKKSFYTADPVRKRGRCGAWV